jgi:uncharacterized protein YggE
MAACVVLLLAAATHAGAGEERPDVNIMTVTGTGEVRVVPDVAVISLGVETRHAQASQAIEQNNRLMTAVVQAIRAQNVPERNIQTSRLSVSREYEPVREGQRPNPVYVVRNIVTVRLMDVQRVGAVLDAATEAGANTVHGISFISERDQQAREEALRQAVRDARAKADVLAQALGVRLEGVESVYESSGPIILPQQADAAETFVARTQAPVSPGENVIRANVTVRYRLAR